MSDPVVPHRILYYYPHVHADTGSPRALLNTIESLDRERFEPLFLTDRTGPLVDALRADQVTIVHGRVTSLSPRFPLASAAGLWRQWELLRTLRPAIVHLHEGGWNYDLIFAAWLRHIPVILHVHNPIVASPRNLHWRLATQVVFVSKAHRAGAQFIERIAAKSIVVHNAIDVARFAAGRSLRTALGLHDSDIAIGTVAQVSRRKGIDLILDVAARLLPSHERLVFLLIGPDGVDEGDFAEACRTRAAEPALYGRVRFLGSRKDIPDLLRTCDVFFLPTRAEPFGMVVAEAMAAGVPVVASRIGGIPEIITSDQTGWLVDELTTEHLSRALEQVVTLPDLGRAVGAQGQRSLSGRFDLVTVGRRWNEIYGALLAAGAGGRRRKATSTAP